MARQERTRPPTAIAAPTQPIAAYPAPADRTSPPAPAPIAFAVLAAEWIIEAARVGAPGATSNSRACMLGITVMHSIPRRTTPTTAVAGYRTSTVKPAIAAATATRPNATVPSTDRSASRPPTTVPIVIPTPKSASTAGIHPREMPDTSIRVLEM